MERSEMRFTLKASVLILLFGALLGSVSQAQVEIIVLDGTNIVDYRILNTNFAALNTGLYSLAIGKVTNSPSTNGPWVRLSNQWVIAAADSWPVVSQAVTEAAMSWPAVSGAVTQAAQSWPAVSGAVTAAAQSWPATSAVVTAAAVAYTNSAMKQIRVVGQTTNILQMEVRGVGFKPTSCIVWWYIYDTLIRGSGWVDSYGAEYCNGTRSSGLAIASGTWSSYVITTGGQHYTDFVSWDADGATFNRAIFGTPVTQNIAYTFLFFK